MSVRALFFNTPKNKLFTLSLRKKFLLEFLNDGRTPARALSDNYMLQALRYLQCEGCVIELGAGGDYYRKMMPSSQNYLLSNIAPGYDYSLDMESLDLPSNSVDAFVSVFAIEHTYNYQKSIDEIYRVLKPGGRFLLLAPFMYYYHGAPDDYFRFSSSALDRMLENFNILTFNPLGSRALVVAEFSHIKNFGSALPFFSRLFLRFIILPSCARDFL